MELQPIEQAVELLKKSRTPLISIPERPTTDAIAAALGLLLVLEKMDQRPRIVSPKFSLPPSHSFLPKSDAIEQDLTSLQDFILTVDLGRTKLESLSYNLESDKLHIHLKPKQGFYEPKDVTTSAGQFAHDLILVLDTPTLDHLGRIASENAEFFYHTPTINIDHHSSNNRFGNVNLVDVVANSVSEIVFELIKALKHDLMDEQLATTLLTGIMSKTKAFQSQSVTPRSLAVASHLVSAGARRDEIVKNLYQTKSISTLRLWGHALSKLQMTPDKNTVWTAVTQSDLKTAQASPNDAPGVLDELMVNTPGAKYYLLFVEHDREVEVILNHSPEATVPQIATELKQRTSEQLRGRMPGRLTEVTNRVLEKLR